MKSNKQLGLPDWLHPPDACTDHHCAWHSPSDHHMKTWPLNFRFDRYLTERICPHNIGHPDPDDLAYHRTRLAKRKVVRKPWDADTFDREDQFTSDPQIVAQVNSDDADAYGVHGCDGCCSRSEPRRSAASARAVTRIQRQGKVIKRG